MRNNDDTVIVSSCLDMAAHNSVFQHFPGPLDPPADGLDADAFPEYIRGP